MCVREPSLLTDNLTSADVVNTYIGQIHVHIKSRKAIFEDGKVREFWLTPSPGNPLIAGRCDWFQSSAAWAHSDNKMACGLSFVHTDANGSPHACAKTYRQVGGGSRLHSLRHATGVKTCLDSQKWRAAVEVGQQRSLKPLLGHCFSLSLKHGRNRKDLVPVDWKPRGCCL